MKTNQTYRGDRFEIAVRGHAGISKILHWDEKRQQYVEPKSIKGCQAKLYRAIKHIRMQGKSRKVQAKFDTLDEARKWRISEEIKPIKQRTNAYTLIDLIKEWQDRSKYRFAETTQEVYAKDVTHIEYLYDVPVEELQAKDIDDWLAHLISDKYSKPKYRLTFRREVKTLKTILNWYREYKNPKYSHPILKRHLKDAVFTKEPIKKKIPLSETELENFLNWLRTHSQKSAYYYLATFQALSGARIGEACGLRWQDVDFVNKRVYIRQIVNWHYKTREPRVRKGTKTGKERIIVLCERLCKLLISWKAANEGYDYVFHNSGKLLTYPAIQNAYNKAYRALGLSQRSTHIIRHTFATIHADQTKDIRATQEALGHSDLKTTQKYAHSSEKTQENALKDFILGKSKPKKHRHEIRFSLKGLEKLALLSPNDPQDDTIN